MSKKAIVYGGGSTAQHLINLYLKNSQSQLNILYFVDDNPSKRGCSMVLENGKSYPILPSSEILSTAFDVILMATGVGVEDLVEHLNNMGVANDKIDLSLIQGLYFKRIDFLKKFAEYAKQINLEGNLAEIGVYKGHFAKKINEFFPNKKLYLFDTFEGFSEKDFTGHDEGAPNLSVGYMGGTNVDIVMNKMLYKENVEIRKGWFPETAQGINDKFCFISYDCDLYEPTVACLEKFYPMLVKNGVILVDDYFSKYWPGVKKATDEFLKKYNDVLAIPLGDERSLIIIKS